MNEEKITVTFNGESEFIRDIMPELLNDESIGKIMKDAPFMALLLPIFGIAVWKALSKYSRMQELVKTFVDNKDNEEEE